MLSLFRLANNSADGLLGALQVRKGQFLAVVVIDQRVERRLGDPAHDLAANQQVLHFRPARLAVTEAHVRRLRRLPRIDLAIGFELLLDIRSMLISSFCFLFDLGNFVYLLNMCF